MEIKEIKQKSAEYELVFNDDEVFYFKIVFDREEWVLQGEETEGRGIRYSEAELKAILKILSEKNEKPNKKK